MYRDTAIALLHNAKIHEAACANLGSTIHPINKSQHQAHLLLWLIINQFLMISNE